jgi:type IV pilus assembly protein PilA
MIRMSRMAYWHSPLAKSSFKLASQNPEYLFVIEPIGLNVVLRKDPPMLARFYKMQEEKEEGFTLIELLVVIIIIGILAAIAIPVFLNQRKKGYDAGIKSDLRNAATAEETYLTDYGAYTTNTTSGAAAGLAGEGFKYSNKTDYKNGALTITATYEGSGTNTGYCLTATSASGKQFYYDSNNGGLLTSPDTCS